MDSVYVMGLEDEKLMRFLGKMGYSIVRHEESTKLAEVIAKQVIDLIIIDSRADRDSVDLCEFFRNDDETKKVPIVYLAKSRLDVIELKNRGVSDVEFVELPYSLGLLVSKIATRMRLRKFAGMEKSASVTEMNCALQDLNKRLTSQLDEARNLQHALLPQQLPSNEHFQMGAYYDPLDQVGGDWYFARTEPSGKITVQIADVTGHGLSAAFIATMTKLALTAAQSELPDKVLQVMNHLITPTLPPGKFVTMSSYLYDPATGLLQLARAGHLPTLIRRKSGEIEKMLPPGFAVGMFDDAEFPLQEITLGAGDLVMMFTDGIPEAQNRNFEMYGMDRFIASFQALNPEQSASDHCKQILADFERFVDGRVLKDDVTLVMLRHIG